MTRTLNQLRGMIVAQGYTLEQMARIIGISPASMSQRMTGRIDFKLEECYDILRALGLAPHRLCEYFPPRPYLHS